MTKKTIPIPPGGFATDEQEAAWSDPGQLTELLLISLKAAGKRAVKAERARLDGR